jgi:hypothetical protein
MPLWNERSSQVMRNFWLLVMLTSAAGLAQAQTQVSKITLCHDRLIGKV